MSGKSLEMTHATPTCGNGCAIDLSIHIMLEELQASNHLEYNELKRCCVMYGPFLSASEDCSNQPSLTLMKTGRIFLKPWEIMVVSGLDIMR
jgi:hypothetical protein